VYPVITTIGIWSALVVGAVYMLRAIRTLLHGMKGEQTPEVKDLKHLQRLPYALLVAVLLLFGFYPKLITDKISKSNATFEQAKKAQAPTGEATE
jgi:NADH:ubiquinone oxidoreductase subunit 4 (subunit M)